VRHTPLKEHLPGITRPLEYRKGNTIPIRADHFARPGKAFAKIKHCTRTARAEKTERQTILK